MKVGKIKSLLFTLFGCFYAITAYSAASLFSDYGQIQNVQNYSTNPFWTPNSPYNQKMPQPVYVQGTAISNEECVNVLQSAVSMQCMARNNCKNTTLSDIRPAIIVQLSNLPNKAYSTACIGYLDTVYESYVAQYGNNAPTGRVDFPTATTPNPALNNNAPVIKNPYKTQPSKWKQEINERANELEQLQKQTNSVNTGLAPTAFPTTYADLSFTERLENNTEGYAPYKGTTAYRTINVNFDTADWCNSHPSAKECKEYEEIKKRQEVANNSSGGNKNDKPNFNGSNKFINDCVAKFINDDTKWQNALSSIFKDVASNADLTQDVITAHQAEIYNLLATNTKEYCLDNIGLIAKNGGNATINFKHNNKNYSFNFSVEELFKYLPIRVAILVLKDRSKKANDIITKSEMPTDYWWNKDCSDHIIWSNLDDDAAINKAGQAVFTEFGGSEHEYFIDFPVGSSNRAFPGLILQEKTGVPKTELIIVYNNLQTGLARIDNFVKALKGQQCSRDGLAAYLVAIDAEKIEDSNDITHLIGGAAGAAVAGAAVVVPIMSLLPTDIADIQQVAVIDGPYNID